jgi:RNA polymerase sigma-70 factor (ECF subfamily)
MEQPTVDPEELRRQLTRSVRRVCPPWLADRSEDIVQNAVIRVLESRPRASAEHPSHPPASYLWRVAYSATVDEIRRVRRRQEVGMETPGLEQAAPPERREPWTAVASAELQAALNGCLDRLNEDRRLIVGFHLLGHDLSECEALSGWQPKKVRNLLYRGLAAVRACLARKGFAP